MILRSLLWIALGGLLAEAFVPQSVSHFSTLVAPLSPGPDPNTHTGTYQFGLVLPWLETTRVWNELSGRNDSRIDGFRAEWLILRVVLLSLIGAMLSRAARPRP